MSKLPGTITGPDDPRHGTDAGAQAHREAGETPCQPCQDASLRYVKGVKLRLARGERRRVPLGDEAWRIIHGSTRDSLRSATGIQTTYLCRLERGGPGQTVHVDTRRKILAARKTGRLVTIVGIQRRLQALSAIGYSAAYLSNLTGIDVEALKRLRRRRNLPRMVRPAARIVAAYDDLHMNPAPRSRSSVQARTFAAREGWLPPLAWDDIDNVFETPAVDTSGRPRTDVDEAIVLRLLLGERMPSTPAEKAEVCRIWAREGRPMTQLEDIHGWKSDRYYKPTAQAVAS